MTAELETARELVRSAVASLERSRDRIDDLNVYPVPDGDTGTNMASTARAVLEAAERSRAPDQAAFAAELTRAALLGARGNSGVILSQIIRGACDALANTEAADAASIARALRAASDASYAAVRDPVEGTMLTVVRELAEGAEERAVADPPPGELLVGLVHHGEEALARTEDLLDVLREARVVDAGGAGVVELLRGIAAAVSGEPVPDALPAHAVSIGAAAVHQERSRYCYCTAFIVEGDDLDAAALEQALEPFGDSLLVVGDRTALKVHVHTDDPGGALRTGTAIGTLDRVEVANMHRQSAEREERLAATVATDKTCEAVAIVSGEGNRRLFESLGAGQVIDGGRTMNPSTEQILDAVEATAAPEAVVLPNNANVIMSAEQAARHASKPVRVVQTRSIQEGLAALVAYNPTESAEANAAEMHQALEAVATGAVTVASRDAELNGVAVREGCWLGLVDGDAVACSPDFDDVARTVLGRLLGEPRGVVTVLTGENAPSLDAVRTYLEREHPDLELEIEDGGQPHYALLLAAE